MTRFPPLKRPAAIPGMAIAMAARVETEKKPNGPKMPISMADAELSAAIVQLNLLIEKDEKVIALRRAALDMAVRELKSRKPEVLTCE